MRKRYGILILLVIVLGIGISLVGAPKVHALMNLNPDPGSGIPAAYRDSFRRCDEQSPPVYSPAFNHWISAVGSAATTTIDVEYGATSVNLQLNFAGATCKESSNVIQTNTKVMSANQTTNLVGREMNLNFGDQYQQLGTYRDTATPSFTYTPTGGFTRADGIYTVEVTTKTINQFGANSYECVTPEGEGIPTSSLANFNPCPITSWRFVIRINVLPAPLVGQLDGARCDGNGIIDGWAYDKGATNNKVTIRVRAGTSDTGSSNPLVAQYTADKARGDSSEGVSLNGHGFSESTLGGLPAGLSGADYLAAGKTIAQYVKEKGGALKFFVYAVDLNNPSRTVALRNSPQTVACRPVCSLSITNPTGTVTVSVVEPNEQFRVRGTVKYEGPPLNYTSVLNIVEKGTATTAPGFTPRTAAARSAPANPNTDFTGLVLTVGKAYEVRWRVNYIWNGVATDELCASDLAVATKPYFRTYGNDVAAGARFGEGCTVGNLPNSKASILAFAKQTSVAGGTQWAGAGSQLAALALGGIWEHFSAANQSPNRSSPESTPPMGLTFGNYFNPSPTYGGQGGQFRCLPDYFGMLTEGMSASAVNSLTLTNGSPAVAYYRPANAGWAVNISANPSLTGSHVVVVEGDVYINSNITYAGYSNASQIPSLYIVAKGNIYIGSGVQDISGVFIAQPNNPGDSNDPKGTISTCGVWLGGAASVAATQLATTCNNRLTVNGAFIAQRVKLLRTNGTLSNSSQNESWSDTDIAEVFKASPEMYLSVPSQLKKTEGDNKTYDSITSLPPVL